MFVLIWMYTHGYHERGSINDKTERNLILYISVYSRGIARIYSLAFSLNCFCSTFSPSILQCVLFRSNS